MATRAPAKPAARPRSRTAAAKKPTAPRRRKAKEPLVRLDLAGGQNVREGFECVDLYAEKADHRVDLRRFPWPWADNSVDELHCSHYVEHIPLGEVERADGTSFDALCVFMDECWRISKNGTMFTVVHPFLKGARAFQDPTHRRFIPGETWSYFSLDARKAMGVDHYPIACNFNVQQIGWSWLDQSIESRSDEYKQRSLMRDWDIVGDLYVTLVAVKDG